MRQEEFEKTYLQEAESWVNDQLKRSESYNRRSDKIIAGLCAVLIVLGITFVQLFPLKKTVHEVMVLDKVTGIIEAPVRLVEAVVDLDQAFVSHYLQDFLQCREGYSFEGSEECYYKAAAFMSPQLQEEWSQLWLPENKASPVNRYGKATTVDFKWVSAVPYKNDAGRITQVAVRFTKTTKKGAESPTTENRIATVHYQYVDVAKQPRERRYNPAGWQVTAYRTDQETFSSQSAQAAPK